MLIQRNHLVSHGAWILRLPWTSALVLGAPIIWLYKKGP